MKALVRVILAFFILSMLSLPQGVAFACPSGTVFSAYKGSGLCLHRGRGLDVAAKCATIDKNWTECPRGWKLNRKRSDPNNNYCCPRKIAVAVPSCDAQCAPLKTSVTPESEANRVHFNCMNLCAGSKRVQCPDGRIVNNAKC